MITLLLLAACSPDPTDTSGSKDSDTAVDTAGGDTDTGGGDTTDTTVDTSDTSDTSDTTDTTDTGDSGPPDDGGPESRASCQADWVETLPDGDTVGVRTYDSAENQVTDEVEYANGANSAATWTFDEEGCQTQYIVTANDKDGVHTRTETNSTCDPAGNIVHAIVIAEIPGDGEPTITTTEFRFENGTDDQGRLILTTTWRIEEDATETYMNAVHYFYDTNGNLYEEWTDIDDDDVEDSIINYGYDPEARMILTESDMDADGTPEFIFRSAYFASSNREYRITSISPDDESVISFKEFTWTCP